MKKAGITKPHIGRRNGKWFVRKGNLVGTSESSILSAWIEWLLITRNLNRRLYDLHH